MFWHGRRWWELFEEEVKLRIRLERQLAMVIEQLADRPHALGATQVWEAISRPSLVRDGLRQAGEALSALTILGFAVYAAVWALYSSFCSEFDVRPEDIGLTYAAILIRAGLGFAPLFIALLVPVILLQVVFSREAPGYPENPWAIYVTWWALGIWAAILWFLPGDISETTQTVFLVGIAFLLTVILLVVFMDSAFARLRERWSSVIGRIVAIAVAVVLLVAVLYVPDLAGQRVAQSVKDGRDDTGGLDLNVVAVHVIWTSTAPPPELPADPVFMYLGQAEQTMVLYETKSKITYRVPSQSVLLVHEHR